MEFIRFLITAALLLTCGVVDAAQTADLPPTVETTDGSAPSRYQLRRFWTVADGLPQMSVTSFAQTDDGFLWIGTFGGLARFDGVRFEIFTQLSTPELGSSRITALYVDREGALWIGTNNSDIARYQNGLFELIKSGAGTTSSGVKWFGEDNEGTLWVNDSMGRWFDRATRTFRDDRSIDEMTSQFWADHLLVREEKVRVARQAREDTPRFPTRSVFCDRQGQYWIGFDGGMALYKEKHFVELKEGTNGIPREIVAMADDGDGGLYLSHKGARPLLRYSQNDGESSVTDVSPESALSIWSMLTTSDGTFWAQDFNGFWRLRDGAWDRLEFRNYSVPFKLNMVEDQLGRVWFSGPGRLNSIEGDLIVEHEYFDQPPVRELLDAERSIANWLMVDRAGSIWFVLYQHVFRMTDGKVELVWSPTEVNRGEIRGIHQASDGTVWGAFYGGGIARFGDGETHWIDTTRGLPNDFVSQIIDSEDGTVWMNTNAGLIRCRLEDANAVVEGRLERLRCQSFYTSECNPGPAFETSEGLLVMPSTTGILIVDPGKAPVAPPPPVPELTGVSSMTSTFGLSQPVEAPLGDRNIAIGFTAPWLYDPANAEFEHRLVGLHDDWRAGGSNRSVRYGDLAPGSYRFEVRTVGEDGTRSESIAGINLDIPAHFYELLWVRVAAVLLIVMSGVVLYELRIIQGRRRNRILADEVQRRMSAEHSTRELAGHLINSQELERSRIARDLHDDLGQRLALVSIKAGTIANSEDPQPETIHSICDDLQSISRDIHDISHSLHPAKLDQLGLVLAVRAFCGEITKAESITIDFRAHGEFDTVGAPINLCLYRVIQEALRNVVKHSRATRAEIELTLDARVARLSVRDNGRGFDVQRTVDQSGTGLGLLSMRERVRFVGGQITADSGPGKGTVISVILPLDPEPQDHSTTG